MPNLMTALVSATLLLIVTLAPALAEPLPPAYYLPTPAEMLSGFELTKSSGPHFNQPGTAYQEIRTYTRSIPSATLMVVAAISPDPEAAHRRMATLIGDWAISGWQTQPMSVIDENGTPRWDEGTGLWQIDGPINRHTLVWRTRAILGSVTFISSEVSTDPHSAGFQMGVIARPMLDRMATP